MLCHFLICKEFSFWRKNINIWGFLKHFPEWDQWDKNHGKPQQRKNVWNDKSGQSFTPLWKSLREELLVFFSCGCKSGQEWPNLRVKLVSFPDFHQVSLCEREIEKFLLCRFLTALQLRCCSCKHFYWANTCKWHQVLSAIRLLVKSPSFTL